MAEQLAEVAEVRAATAAGAPTRGSVAEAQRQERIGQLADVLLAAPKVQRMPWSPAATMLAWLSLPGSETTDQRLVFALRDAACVPRVRSWASRS